MKIRYIYPPLFKPFYPMATRIITENLLRDNRLDVDFSDMPVRTFASNTDKELYDSIISKAHRLFSPNVVSFLKQKYMLYNIFYVFMAHGYFDEDILIDSDTEYNIVTCLNFCDLIIIKQLLENKQRVVLGGPLVNIGLSPSFIRDFLRLMGVHPSRLFEDLIIISGSIDLTTDLYRLIRAWKDTTITDNDYGTVYDCQRDFLKDLYDSAVTVPVHLGFHNRCWYGKCKFCTYRELPKMDFLTNRESGGIANSIHNIMDVFGSNHIRFIDSYFRSDSPLVRDILRRISRYDITVYTGITMLKDKKHIDFINSYFNCLLIGMESTSDFSLSQADKGYGYRDIEIAVDNIIKYLDKRIFLEISIILDLPCRDVEDAKANYARIAELRGKLDGEGFRVAFHMNTLSVFPNLELLHTKDHLLGSSKDRSDISKSTGKNYIISVLRECGMDRPSLLPANRVIMDEHNVHNLIYGYVSSDVPIIRRDIHGNTLPSDLELMEEGIMRDILARKSRKS